MHFFPINYARDTIIPATMQHASQKGNGFEEITLTEIMKFLGLIYLMEIYKFPSHCMYLSDLEILATIFYINVLTKYSDICNFLLMSLKMLRFKIF